MEPTSSVQLLPAGSSLSEHFEKSGTSGRGVEVLKQLEKQEKEFAKSATDYRKPPRARSRTPVRTAAQPEPTASTDTATLTVERKRELKQKMLERRAFIAERISIPQGTNKNRRKQMAGTNLVYHKCDEKTRKGLDGSRAKEWRKYMDFHATVKIQGEILDELIQEGYTAIPSQWIETDKKAHLKRPGQEHLHEPELKSRLVACGHLEDAKDVRADSPTCSTEGFNLICSFAACRKLRLKCADLTNAYFTADPTDRLLLMKPP